MHLAMKGTFAVGANATTFSLTKLIDEAGRYILNLIELSALMNYGWLGTTFGTG